MLETSWTTERILRLSLARRSGYEEAVGIADIHWWEQFRDPVPNQLIETALREN